MEDVNIEHLLDVFTTINVDSNIIWDVCSHFMDHLYWHKPRLVMLGPKIEGLPDVHPSKARCLIELSWLFELVGNHTERKRLLIHALELCRMWGDDFGIVRALRPLSDANRLLDLHEEGIQQVNEALEICERLNDVFGRARSLHELAWLFYDDQQFDVAENAASQLIDLLPLDQHLVCQCHRLLGEIHSSIGEIEKAVDHFKTALGIAFSFGWYYEEFWSHCGLAGLFSGQGRFDDSHTHVEHARSHAVNDTYLVGRVMHLKAVVWYRQRKLREAKSEVLCAANTFEKVGAMIDLEGCRDFLCDIEEEMEELRTSGELDLLQC